MRLNVQEAVRRSVCLPIAAGMLLVMANSDIVGAQSQNDEQRPAQVYRTLYLTNLTDQHQAADVVTDLRNMLPRARFYRVESANAISMQGTSEEIAAAQKILADIDRPRRTYRLTYTIGEGATSQGGSQHFVLIATPGNKTSLKQGSRVPIVTGTTGTGSDQNTQVQYMDVGVNVDASLEPSGDELRLYTKFEQTSVAEEKSSVGIQDPLIHQSVLQGESTLAPGKPLVLGSMDLPASGKHVELSVVAEVVK